MEASLVGEESRSAQDAAFERFYRRYAQHVYRYTLALLRNPADAEDVTQTTFLNAYRAMRQGQYPQRPHHWLIKIAHNACRSRYVMRRRRVTEVPLDEALDQLVIPEEEKPNVRLVLRALGRLPFNQRAALVMRELEGRSYAEIAETLGVSVSAVEMLIFRARKAMRLQARSLRVLGAVQLPGSLASFFGSGGGIAATAGAGGVLGAGVAVKLVAALAAATAVIGTSGGALIADAGNTTTSALRPPEAAALGDRATQTKGEAPARSAGTEWLQRKAVTTRQASRPRAGSAQPGEDTSDRAAGAATPGAQGQPGSAPPQPQSSPIHTVTKTVRDKVPAPNPPVNVPAVGTTQVSAPALAPLPVEPPALPPPPKLPVNLP